MIYFANKANFEKKKKFYFSSPVKLFPPVLCVHMYNRQRVENNREGGKESSGKLIIVSWELLNWLAAKADAKGEAVEEIRTVID